MDTYLYGIVGFPRMDLFWWKVEKNSLASDRLHLLILSDDNIFIKDLFWKATW